MCWQGSAWRDPLAIPQETKKCCNCQALYHAPKAATNWFSNSWQETSWKWNTVLYQPNIILIPRWPSPISPSLRRFDGKRTHLKASALGQKKEGQKSWRLQQKSSEQRSLEWSSGYPWVKIPHHQIQKLSPDGAPPIGPPTKVCSSRFPSSLLFWSAHLWRKVSSSKVSSKKLAALKEGLELLKNSWTDCSDLNAFILIAFLRKKDK